MKTQTSPTGRNHHSSSWGFTLIEVLLALFILSVFMTVALTRIEAILPQGALRLAARTIIGEITWTRGKAASTHSDLILEFNGTDNTIACHLANEEPGGRDANPTGQRQGRIVKLPEGVGMRAVVVSSRPGNSEGSTNVRFYANGTLDPLVVYIANEQDVAFRMKVNPLTGEVRLYEDHGEQSPRG